jgi:hypothetical protein
MWLPVDDWRVQRRARPEQDHHLFTWTPQLLANLLWEVGFDVSECAVVTYIWPPRLYTTLYRRLPRIAFDGLCRALALLLRRRQLKAVAAKPR